MSKPIITVVGLIYKSPHYLSFMLEGINRPENETPFRTLIIGCDSELHIAADPRVDFVYRNANPLASPGHRTYHAWNYGASICKTPYVCFFNSDMYGYDHWLDELMLEIVVRDPKTIPTSLLVENGRIPSAFPEYVKHFGTPTPPSHFDRDAFYSHAAGLQKPGVTSRGRLNMPVVFDTADFLARGGFPTWDGGDTHLFGEMVKEGYRWVTCEGSIVYHTCRGEAAGD